MISALGLPVQYFFLWKERAGRVCAGLKFEKQEVFRDGQERQRQPRDYYA
jgi:hypothetical protein